MPRYQLAGVQEMKEFRLFGFRISNSSILNDGFQMACGVALAACTWKSNFHPTWSLSFSAMAIEGAFHCCRNLRNYYNELPSIQRMRILSTSTAVVGTVGFFSNIASLSKVLKGNDTLWLYYLIKAGVCYFLAVTAVNRIADTFFTMKPFYKFCEVLFGPALIGSAAYYLLVFQRLYKEWLCCIPLFASTAAATQIRFRAYRRLNFLHAFRNAEFVAIELLVSGCVFLASGSALFVYSINHHAHPFISLLFIFIILYGVADIECSVNTFYQCVRMPVNVYYYLCCLIGGPFIFFAACVAFGFINDKIMLSLPYIIITGLGLGMIGRSLCELSMIVPPPIFERLLLGSLGSMTLVYSLMASAYIGYRMGWRFSLFMTPLVVAGACGTYEGWK